MLRNKDDRLTQRAACSPGGKQAPYLTDKVSVAQMPPTESTLIRQRKQFCGQTGKVAKLPNVR